MSSLLLSLSGVRPPLSSPHLPSFWWRLPFAFPTSSFLLMEALLCLLKNFLFSSGGFLCFLYIFLHSSRGFPLFSLLLFSVWCRPSSVFLTYPSVWWGLPSVFPKSSFCQVEDLLSLLYIFLLSGGGFHISSLLLSYGSLPLSSLHLPSFRWKPSSFFPTSSFFLVAASSVWRLATLSVPQQIEECSEVVVVKLHCSAVPPAVVVV